MDVLKNHLVSLEKQLLIPSVRANIDELKRLISDDFIEVGASGRRFGINDVLVRLPQESSPQFKNYDFELRLLSESLAQLCYGATIIYNDDEIRHSRRTSLWRQNQDGLWQICYHQGTPCSLNES